MGVGGGMGGGFRVYLPDGPFRWCWRDLLITPDKIFTGDVVRARYVLVDVGLESLVKSFGRVDYPRFWLDKYFTIVKGLAELKPGRVWAVIPDYPSAWSGVRIDHYFLRHWRIFFKLWPELEDYYMPVIRSEGLGLWELGMMLDTLKPFLRDFEVLGLPSRPTAGSDGLWLARAWRVRQAFPDHWIHGLGAGFGRVKLLSPGLLDSIDFRGTFTRIELCRSMAKIYLGLEGVWEGGSQNSAPRLYDYRDLQKALLETLIMLLEERVGRVDYAWRRG
jgi:hypothetical protein